MLYAFIAKDTNAPVSRHTVPPTIKGAGAKGPAAVDKRLKLETSLKMNNSGLLDTFHIFFGRTPVKFFDIIQTPVLTMKNLNLCTNYLFVRIPLVSR